MQFVSVDPRFCVFIKLMIAYQTLIFDHLLTSVNFIAIMDFPIFQMAGQIICFYLPYLFYNVPE